MGHLDGKVAIITGGGNGIGREHALLFAREGAKVVVNDPGGDRHGEGTDPAAEQVAQEIRSAGGAAVANLDPVGSFESAAAIVASAVDAYGRLDIVVNNAGINRDQLIMRMKPADFDDVIATNLRGTWNVCRAASRPMLRARSGRIINLSSVVAGMGNPGQSNYAASKGGVEALTRSLARELGSRGITVNAVAPGFIETDMTADMADRAREAMVERIPLGELGTVEDVARAVRFLASDDAGYITGQVIHVNGGLD